MTSEARIRTLRDLLAWSTPIDALSPLVSAVKGSGAGVLSEESAVCFDANVFLNLGKGRKASEVIDYFAERHKGPLIVPHQVLLEFWNNHLTSVETVIGKLSRQFGELNKIVEEIDPEYASLREGSSRLAKEFEGEWGHVFSEATQTDLIALLEMLATTAFSSQVDRASFTDLAKARKRTKTPPGFKDEGDGDFYLWVELLNGLLLAQEAGRKFDRVLLVTDDVKKDWSTNGSPNPMLVAEIASLCQVPFQVMRLADLKRAVQEALK